MKPTVTEEISTPLNDDKKPSIKQEILEWVKSLLIAFVLFFIINFFISTTTVYSTSMFPTLIEGDRLLLHKTHNIQRGDIVSFESDLTLTERDIETLNFIQKFMVNTQTKKNLIKRVIAVPGDKIDIENGVVFINDKKLDEPYISTIAGDTLHVGVLPEGQYFMMGDNRAGSLDSRKLGPVNGDRIIGKTVLRFYPFDRFGTVN